MGEIPKDWRKANLTFIFKKGKKDNPENYGLVSLTPSTCGKIMEEAICRHKKEQVVTGDSQLAIDQG